MKLFFITGNKGKYDELSQFIPGVEMLSIQNLPEIQSTNPNEVIEAKLVSALALRGKKDMLIVEDTSLSLKALNGFPGPLIKHLLEAVGVEGIYRLCKKLEQCEAVATTVFGMYFPETMDLRFFDGNVQGTICQPKGSYGFGWDAIFVPDGSHLSFAEMKDEKEKSEYSMRGIALNKLKTFIAACDESE